MLLRIALLSVVLLSACKPSLIPDSSVPDTRENRAVMSFMDSYKNAVTERSVGDIMLLVSPDYLETSGTPEPQDDFNYKQLQEKLQKTFAQIKEVSLRFYIQNITRKDNKIMVYYFFNQHVLVNLSSGEQWITSN